MNSQLKYDSPKRQVTRDVQHVNIVLFFLFYIVLNRFIIFKRRIRINKHLDIKVQEKKYCALNFYLLYLSWCVFIDNFYYTKSSPKSALSS